MKAERITSRKNPLIQQIRRLLTSRKDRQELGLYVSDGTKLLEEALRWDSGLQAVVLTDSAKLPPLPDHVAAYIVPEDIMGYISPMKAPQGAVFICRLPQPRAGVLRPGTLILEGIQDPGNLGTILRTADALDVPVVLADGCADPYSWKTVRASMGAVFRTPPMFLDTASVIAACKAQRIPLAATALRPEAEDIRRAPLQDMAVVIGSEGNGVSESILQQCDKTLIIPMNSRCESLNAAAAATIVMWQMELGKL